MNGPLHGVRIIELAGLGALPYGSLRLADMGADIVRVERLADVPDEPVARPRSTWDRGRRSIAIDLKHPDGVATVLRLAAGLATSTALVLVAAWATSSGRGGVARLANWVIGSDR